MRERSPRARLLREARRAQQSVIDHEESDRAPIGERVFACGVELSHGKGAGWWVGGSRTRARGLQVGRHLGEILVSCIDHQIVRTRSRSSWRRRGGSGGRRKLRANRLDGRGCVLRLITVPKSGRHVGKRHFYDVCRGGEGEEISANLHVVDVVIFLSRKRHDIDGGRHAVTGKEGQQEEAESNGTHGVKSKSRRYAPS